MRTQERLRGEPTSVYMSYGNFSETFLATSSENSQTWHTSRFCGDRYCLQIGAASVNSGRGGGNKGSKLGSFHTFHHVKRTVFGTSEIQAVLLHSS